MGLSIADADLNVNHLQMGCYGIGVSRIVAAAIEQNYDEKGIIWPKSISPFQIALVEIDGHKNEPVRSFASEIYRAMKRNSVETILDDRNAKLGNKLHDWELMGIPNIAIIGKKEAENNIVTFKKRNDSEKESLSIDQLISKIGAD